jgi:PTS system fructose-specific IIC component
MAKYQLIAATGCPTGIAHTYMAKEALEEAARKKGITIKVETHGQVGVENELTAEEIREADAVIIAADKDVHPERFAGKRIINVSVTKGIKEPEQLIADALSGKGKIADGVTSDNQVDRLENEEVSGEGLGRFIYKNLMNGVSHMLPFVVAGGVLIAISFLFGIYSYDPKSDQYNAFAAQLKDIGGLAMGLMVPILSAYIAEGVAKRPGLVVGFVGGLVASNSGTGFLGGIVSGFLAGAVVLGLMRLLKVLPKQLDGLKAIFLYPVLGVFITGSLMYLLAGPMQAVNEGMMSFLSGFENSNPLILGLIVGAMCAFDMGGPVNKAAYVTGTALLAQGNTTFMAGVSAACIAPPLATGVAVMVFRKYYDTSDRNAGLVNIILGSTHITEGAIPFAAKNPLWNLPSFMIGSAVAAILTYSFNVQVPAPHGGFLVLPVVTHGLLWVISILIGSAIGGILLGLVQKRSVEKMAKDEKEGQITEVKKSDVMARTPLNTADLLQENQVSVHQDLKTQDEVFDFLAQQAVTTGIARNAAAVLKDLKKRELEGTTGMTDGFAIPHAKSEAITTPSILVVKLKEGIDWQSLDGQPINLVISLLIPADQAGQTHLQLLSKLATLLMKADFRQNLNDLNNPSALADYINQQLIEKG